MSDHITASLKKLRNINKRTATEEELLEALHEAEEMADDCQSRDRAEEFEFERLMDIFEDAMAGRP